MTDVIATLAPSLTRRVTSTGFLAFTGAALLWVSLTRSLSVQDYTAYLLALGALMLFLAWRLWFATAASLHLTEEGIFDSNGQCLCRIEDIEAVERGVFAFKPSNGFTLQLRRNLGLNWSPGLWWRFGRRLGVGGVTPASQGKYMSEMLALRIRPRSGT